MKKIILFDTTLRDGAQRENINFSLEDKLRIARLLADFGIDYIEAGWPSSNPKDKEFFSKVKNDKKLHPKIVAFCSTRKKDVTPDKDLNLLAVVESGVRIAAMVGKTSVAHVEKVLKTTKEENLKMISDSISFLKKKKIQVIFDAEHFFDGFKEDGNYALQCLRVAEKAGAFNITLCDTNGGSLPKEIAKIIKQVKKTIKIPLGIHTHNDGGLALANSLAAVAEGVHLVQGTINGYGERCGNADLTQIIPSLQFKMKKFCLPEKSLALLTELSREVSEIANETPYRHQPYVGKSAFTHKGGIHVSAFRRHKSAYEHIDPALVGNKSRILISELAGRSNVLEKFSEWKINIDKEGEVAKQMIDKVKKLEKVGYSFEGAEGSIKLLYYKMKGNYQNKFLPIDYQITVAKTEGGKTTAKAFVRVKIKGRVFSETAIGNGPVNALDLSLRKALIPFYPQLKSVELIDYKVRIPNGRAGTAAKTRVLITSKNHQEIWTTVGASTNIIDASWQALIDSLEYYLLKY